VVEDYPHLREPGFTRVDNHDVIQVRDEGSRCCIWSGSQRPTTPTKKMFVVVISLWRERKFAAVVDETGGRGRIVVIKALDDHLVALTW